MQKIVFEIFISVFLYFYTSIDAKMFSPRVFNYFIVALLLLTPLVGESVVAQVPGGNSFADENFVEYNKLKLRTVENISTSTKASTPSDLIFVPLSKVEDDFAKELNSHWVWSESTLDIIDSYSTFIFRTKKSAKIEEVKILLQVNSMGRLSGVDVQGKVDKGLKERLDFVLRKLPDCKPVPGYDRYGLETFELIIKK